MFFGSHGYSHEWLGSLSKDDLIVELEKCAKFYSQIEDNKENWIMCYPYGDHNQNVIEQIKKIGYKIGLTTVVGDAILDRENTHILKRYDTNDFPQ